MFEIRRPGRLLFAVALALTTLGADALFSQGQSASKNRRIVMLDGREVVEGEVIVRYASQAGQAERERAEYQAYSDASETIGRTGTRRLRSRHLSTRQMLDTLRANPDVAYAEPNYIIRALAMPNDPDMSSLWGLLNTGQVVDGQTGVAGADIGAVPAWDVNTGSTSNIVAVLDSGIDYNHPDLAANMFRAPRQFSVTIGTTTITCLAGTRGFDATNNSCVPFDENGHGTHVAGIVGAVGNNGIGVTGVNWTTSLMALKVLDASGTGTTADAIKAINWVVKAKAALSPDANVRVLNASWGGTVYSQALNDEIVAAGNANILFVAAAGSDGTDNDVTPHYPASSTSNNVVSVTASDNRGELAWFANYGANSVDIAAPGGAVLSTLPQNTYGELGGTSMSAAFVAGAAALLLSECPLSTAALKAQLLSSVQPVNGMLGKIVSGGRLDVNNAIRQCSPELNPVPLAKIFVNGSSTPISVAPGATVTIEVVNGPANVYDWVTIAPTGSADNAYTGIWFLNGTSTPPSTGVSAATFPVTVPTTNGTYEARFLANGRYTRLATSAAITVGNTTPPPPAPAPVLTSISPASVTANSGFVLTATGSNFTSSSQIFVNGAAKATTFVSSSTLTASIAAGDVATAGSRSITVVTPAPGGGTSAAQTLTVTAPSSGLTFTVNGSSGAISVATGATLTIAITGGPGHVYDWVTIAPVGSAHNTYTGIWFMNGTSTPPSTGKTSATFNIPAPTTAGSYEARFLASGGYTRLATSGVITVGNTTPPPPAPVPVLTSISPASVQANAGFVLTATGSSFTAASQIYVNGVAKATSFVSSTTLTASIAAGDVATAGSRSITVVTPAPGGGTSAAQTLTVTAAPSGLTFTVNGSAGAISVSPGATLTIAITNGPGHVYDWVTIVPVGSANNSYTGIWFMNGTSTPPSTGMTSATFNIPASTTAGTYEARFLASGGYTRLATSGVITVGNATPPPPAPVPVLTSISPASVPANAGFVLTATGNSFTNASQIYVNGAAKATTFVSSTTLTASIAASDVASAGSRSITVVTPAPGGGTSAAQTLTVTPASTGPTFTVNGSADAISVSPGASMTIAIAGGPGHVYDWVTVVPVGSPNNSYTGIWFMNGTSTPPSSGMTSASFVIPAPTTSGTYEARFLASGGYTRLATSGVITVGSGTPPASTAPSITVNGSAGAVSVARNGSMTIAVANGPGSTIDWVTVVPVGSPDNAYSSVWFLNGTSTPPSTGMTSATFVIPAPSTAGSYEARFLANGRYTRLATSGVITVNP